MVSKAAPKMGGLSIFRAISSLIFYALHDFLNTFAVEKVF
jgi:hypothetical protein